eukprot:scaffold100646_cov14-Tisochrysis_lutea.AAC.1
MKARLKKDCASQAPACIKVRHTHTLNGCCFAEAKTEDHAAPNFKTEAKLQKAMQFFAHEYKGFTMSCRAI